MLILMQLDESCILLTLMSLVEVMRPRTHVADYFAIINLLLWV